ncbi:MAG: glycosyltransferase family 61 protein [Muribaculaceae bacterium]|nr:glycosyltransferase family 61 protein [Muribaculaceae bacterium]
MIGKLKNKLSGIPIITPFLRKLKFIFFTHKYCKRYDIFTLYQYKHTYDISFSVIDPPTTSFIASLKFYPDNKQIIEETKYPQIEVVEFCDCHVIGESDIVIDSFGNAIYNANIGKNENNFDPALQTGYSCYPTIGRSTYIKVFQKKASDIPIGISLINTIPQNYYHFLHEVIAKFWVLKKLNIPASVPLIVNTRSFSIPQFKELFQFFNEDKRQLIELDHLEQVKVDKLYLITPIKISGGPPRKWNEVSYKYPIYNLRVIDDLRGRLLETQKASTKSFPDKIFISRKNFNQRHYNEAELEEILHDYGFTTVYPEDMSIWDQIDMFNKCKTIVAASGAALTNLLFCSAGTSIIVFLNKLLSMPIYSTISYYLDCNLIYIAADKVKNQRAYHTSFHINPDDLKNVLDQLFD